MHQSALIGLAPWIQSIPRDWEIRRTKTLVTCRKVLNSDGKEEAVLSLTLRGVVDNDPSDPEGLVPADYRTYQIFEANDLVFKLIDLQNRRTSRVGLVPKRGIMSSAYIRLSPRAARPRFLYWQFFDLYQRGIFNELGAGVRSTIGPEALLELPILVPSLSRQDQIAAYLDQETARIDVLIKKKERLIALLVEQRQALISRAVTKGLDPNVRMRDSGVAWLGQIPATWRITRLKYASHGLIDTEHKTAPEDPDGTFLMVRTSNVKAGLLSMEDARYVSEATYAEWTQRGRPEAGDIIFTREAPAGEACIVPQSPQVFLGQRTVLIRTDRARFLPEFILHSLYGGLAAEFIANLSRGSTVAHFNMEDIANLPLMEAPISEQEEVVEALSHKLAHLRKVGELETRAIELLRERRQALITACVTGELNLSTLMEMEAAAA